MALSEINREFLRSLTRNTASVAAKIDRLLAIGDLDRLGFYGEVNRIKFQKIKSETFESISALHADFNEAEKILSEW